MSEPISGDQAIGAAGAQSQGAYGQAAIRQLSRSALKNARRWDAFSRALEVYPDLTFKEWLTHPHFREARSQP